MLIDPRGYARLPIDVAVRVHTIVAHRPVGGHFAECSEGDGHALRICQWLGNTTVIGDIELRGSHPVDGGVDRLRGHIRPYRAGDQVPGDSQRSGDGAERAAWRSGWGPVAHLHKNAGARG